MDYSPQEKIGMRIREIREGNKLTQKELGQSISRSARIISLIENGGVGKYVVLIPQIAKALRVKLEDVLMGEELPKSSRERALAVPAAATRRTGFGLRMKPSLVEKLEILAEKRGLTRNGLIEQVIEDFLAAHFEEEQEDEN